MWGSLCEGVKRGEETKQLENNVSGARSLGQVDRDEGRKNSGDRCHQANPSNRKDAARRSRTGR